jgi:nitroimidazol reductase NimA-like FMN-containing flavoprotein (pyridoxamine 5'-phosphate oxidase superfamily)
MIEMTSDEIDLLLADARIGRLCMADPADGRPYAVPLPFCWGDGALYVRLPLTGRKGELLARNPLVCFEVDAFTDALDEYASVLIEGRLVSVSDLAEKARVKRHNDAKYDRLRGGHCPGHGRATPLSDQPVWKIEVERIARRKRAPAAAVIAT